MIQKNIPIGLPISNTKAYILDKKLKPVPIGVIGELCIAGEGLARGYLNRPDLTAERFVENEFIGERIYRIGDLARWLSDGNIEFVGRVDNQVKIRGYRIEPGEIEQKLLEHTNILETDVLDQKDKDDNKYLVAYFVADNELSIAELKTYLSRELPEYMIPSYFVQLDQMPLTPNGKIDTKALAELEKVRTKEYVAPSSDIEERLVKIWSAILDVEKIGVTDNFFDIGGHSLKATSFISKVFKELNVEIPLREVFKRPTIKEIALFIDDINKNNDSLRSYTNIKKVEERESYPLSSAQKRLYILNKLEGISMTYNMPQIFGIKGEVDKNKLENIFNKLIRRHEAFRTSFEVIDGEVVQRIHEDVEFKISELASRFIKDFVQPFDLSQAPLLRVGLIKEEDETIFVIDMHHIISDGVSMDILRNDFIQLFAGQEPPELRIQYKDYSIWHNELLQTEVMKKQEEYWLERFGDFELPVLNMPTDYLTTSNALRPAVITFEGESLIFAVKKDLSLKLNELAKCNGATLYMVLLAAYNLLLSKYSEQEDIIVGSPIAGRPHVDLENIIGMFVNTLAMRNYPEKSVNVLQSF